MREELIAEIPLVCPSCRTRDEHGRHMFTLSVATRERVDGTEILQGTLACDNERCRHEWPIVDGVPILAPDPAAFLATDSAVAALADLSPEAEARLALEGPDDAPHHRLIEHLSIYTDAHWGDRATPPPDGPGASFGLAHLVDKIAERAHHRVERAVDLGCSVARGVAELARGADLAVGVDLHLGAVRRGRRLLSGEDVPYLRRGLGRHYYPAVARAESLASPRVALVCATVLDPPLVPGAFQRVLALNVLDSVPDPLALLSVADGLLAPGGELILSCPYAFQSGIVDEGARFGGDDPAAWLRDRLTAGEGLETPYTVEDEADVEWSLRRDARTGHIYWVHYLRVRKSASPTER